MTTLGRVMRLFVPGLLLVACGGVGDVIGGLEGVVTTVEDGEAGGGASGTQSESRDTGVVVTVDGEEYQVDTELGGDCDTRGDPGAQTDLKAYGYDVASGLRVELSFNRQAAEFSPSGEEEFYGSLFVAVDDGGGWQVVSLEPWPWLEEDRSRVTGTVTMEDEQGQPVEVAFDVSCP